jgi:hypothetical protein
MTVQTPQDYMNLLLTRLDKSIEQAKENVIRTVTTFPISTDNAAKNAGALLTLLALKDSVLEDRKSYLNYDEEDDK